MEDIMSRKKLIAIGCSFTAHDQRDINQKKIYPFDVWPMHLANKLDMDCVNLGRRGQGNDYISAKLIDTVLAEKKEDIGLVVLMWSGWPRIDFQDIKGEWQGRWREIRSKIVPTAPWSEIKDAPGPTDTEKYFDLWRVDNNEYHMAMKALRYFLIAQRLLEDIPYLMIQGVGINAVKNRELVIQTFINSKIFYEIDEDKFIGWPIAQEIGGYNVENILNKLDPERTDLRISDEDSHPNAEGHKIMAQEIYNAYEKIYT